MLDNLKPLLMQPQSWYRPLTIVCMYFLLSMLGGLLVALYFLVAMVQWGMVLVMGAPNPALKGLMSQANHYVHQLMQYLSGDSDDRPFPFSLLP